MQKEVDQSAGKDFCCVLKYHVLDFVNESTDDISVDPIPRFMENISFTLCKPNADPGSQATRFQRIPVSAAYIKADTYSEGKNFI
jgi:hypothetical protein